MYYLYFLYSADADKFYVGHSSDPWRRFFQHLNNSKDKFTGRYNDWVLSAVFLVSSIKGDAEKVEKFIKRQKSRNLIHKMLDKDFVGIGILAQLVRVPHVRD
jgi:putative endonuclease